MIVTVITNKKGEKVSKKLIFGLMLTCVGVFGFGNNANASWSSSNCVMANGVSADNWQSINCFNADNADKIYVSQDGSWDDWNIPPNFNTCFGECKAGYKKTSTRETIYSKYGNYSCDVTYEICVSCSTSKSCSSSFSGYSGTYDECAQNQSSKCSKSCTNPCSGQAACPSHATCTWNTSATVSGTQYYGGSCNASGTCPISTITCEGGYYKNGNTCTQCPLADGIYTNSARTTLARYTSAAGATSINDCYLQSGEQYYDSRGGFMFASICYYDE